MGLRAGYRQQFEWQLDGLGESLAAEVNIWCPPLLLSTWFLRQDLSAFTGQQVSSWDPLVYPRAEVIDAHSLPEYYPDAGDLISGPHTCRVNAPATEPSPQSLSDFFLVVRIALTTTTPHLLIKQQVKKKCVHYAFLVLTLNLVHRSQPCCLVAIMLERSSPKTKSTHHP